MPYTGLRGIDLNTIRDDPLRTILAKLAGWAQSIDALMSMLVSQTTPSSTAAPSPAYVENGLHLLDDQYVWWSPNASDPITSRSAAIRWRVTGVSPDQFEIESPTTRFAALGPTTFGLGTDALTAIANGYTGLILGGVEFSAGIYFMGSGSTTVPHYQLHDASSLSILSFEDSSLSNSSLYFANTGALADTQTMLKGRLVVGRSYAGVSDAPADGAIIEGQVGIGTTAPTIGYLLDVVSTTGQGIRLQPSSASLAALGESSGGESTFAQFGSSTTTTNSYTSWGMANNTTLGTATAAWGLKMRKNTVNGEKNGLSLEVTGDDATPGSANSGLYGELVYISTTGRWSITDRLIGSANANQRYNDFMVTLRPVGGSVGTINVRSTAGGGIVDVFRISNSGGTPQIVCTSGFLFGFGEDIPLNRVDVSGAQVIGAGYSGVVTAPTNGLLVQGQVGLNATSVAPSRELTVGVGNATLGIAIIPNSGTTTARPQVQWWQDSTATTAFAIGNCIADSGGPLTSLLFSSFASSTWTERMRLVNATGDLLIGTTGDSARLTVQSASGAVAGYFAGVGNANTLTVAGGTITSGTPSVISVTGTWNTATAPTAFLWNQTNTSSNFASKLFDFQVSSGTRLFLDKFGHVEQTFADGTNADLYLYTQRSTFATNTSSHTFFALIPNNSSVSPAISGTVRGFDFLFSGLSGSFTELTGINAEYTTTGLGATDLRGGKITLASYAATITRSTGLDIQWGDDGDAGNFGETTTITNLYGIRIRDEAVNAWDGQNIYGGVSAPAHQYGVLVETTVSGCTDFHAGAFGGNVNINNDNWLYWAGTTSTAEGSKSAGVRYNSGSSRFEMNAAGAGMVYWDATQWRWDTTSALAFDNPGYIYWGGAGDVTASILHILAAEGGSGGTAYKKIILGKSYTSQFGFDVDMSIVTGQRIYWAATPQTVAGSRAAAIVWNGTTFDIEIGTTAEYLFSSTALQFGEGNNMIFGGTTGTKIGTNTNEKIGVWNATPVIKQSGYTQTYATASKTHAAFTSADLTGISTSTTGSALAEPSGTYTQSEMQQNFRRIQDQYNLLRADVDNLKQIVNAIIDDFQLIGWLA